MAGMFQIDGINQLVVDLTKASKTIKSRTKDRVAESIEKVAETAKAFAPVRTGATRESISSEVIEGPGVIAGEAGPTTKQGFFMEHGTYKDAPQVFMGPALDRHSADFEEALGNEAEI